MIQKLANPRRFLKFSHWVLWITTPLAFIVFPYGLYSALITSPADYQQGEYVRIMYVHVPCAWLSMGIYASMAVSSFTALVWRHRLADIYTQAAAPLGAFFTGLCLITGSIWGYPTWGTWWVWDARLTSVFILFLLYLGYLSLLAAFDNKETSQKMGGILILIGALNLPIIKYSVEWWTTLHQPASLTSFSRMAQPAIHPEMIKPLLLMALAMTCVTANLIVIRIKTHLISEKTKAQIRRNISI